MLFSRLFRAEESGSPEIRFEWTYGRGIAGETA